MSIPLTPKASLTGEEFSLILLAYSLGCFTSGYYWTRWRAGLDIRQQGSGNVGARNVGRVLGRPSFVVVLLLDMLKGVLAISAATHFGLRPEAVVAVMVAVVAGHSWPIQLRFAGGKGIATSLGALLIYDPLVTGILTFVFLCLWPFIRNFTLTGLMAFALLPLAVCGCGLGNIEVAATSFLAVLVLITHRRNIREEFARIFPHRELKETAMHRRKDRVP